MRDTAIASFDADNTIIGRVERYDGRGRLRPPQIETEFIFHNSLNKNGLEKNIGLYFSSLREFSGYRFTALPGERINLPLVMSSLNNAPGVWLPGGNDSGDPGGNLPKNYKDLRWFFMPSTKTYGDLSTRVYTDNSPISTATMFDFVKTSDRAAPMKEIVYVLPPGGGKEPLYGLRLDTWSTSTTAYTFPAEWWTRDRGTHTFLKPFNLITISMTQQVSGVTILNNVIDPAKKEHTVLAYTLTRRGRVTINVFTLDGTLVRRLVSETQNEGDHEVKWDGTNQGGRPVARGMYFIRVVAPDIDEFRKVMIVK
jgi:hypothetical protein